MAFYGGNRIVGWLKVGVGEETQQIGFMLGIMRIVQNKSGPV
jgi:hypothetical protein